MPAIVIYEVKNLTSGLKLEFDYEKINTDRFAETLTGTLSTAPTQTSLTTDNIQVLWGTKKGTTDEYDQKYKAIGGSLSYNKKNKKITISGLQDVSKISMGVTGLLEIGREYTPEQRAVTGFVPEVAAQVSVSVGNLNKNKEWIIDFSNKKNGMPGTSIKLAALISWIEKRAPVDAEIDMPKDENTTSAEKPINVEEFNILFNEFHFNLTSKTFKFDVQSEGNNSITFGNFTIKNVGFLVTNEPYVEKEEVIMIEE